MDRLQQVGDRDWVGGRGRRLGVGRPDDLPRLGPTPGEQDRLRHRPVVASRLGVDPRRAPHFAHHDHQRVVQQAPLFEVGDQRGERLVGRGDQVPLQTGEAVEVHVPPRGVDADEPATRLDQPPAQQRALTDLCHAVRLANLGGFRRNAKRLAGFGRGHQVGGLLVVGRHRGGPAGPIPPLLDPRQQLLPARLPECRDPGRGEILDLEVGLAGIGFDHERRVLGSEEARAPRRHRVRHVDVRRDAAPGPQLPGHPRTERGEEFVRRDRVFPVGERRLAPRHHVVIARGVTVVGMTVAADHRELVRQLGAVRAVLGEERSRDRGGNGGERTADLGGGQGLGVPHVLVRGAPLQEQEQHRLGPGDPVSGPGGVRRQHPWQAQPRQQAAGPHPQQVPTRLTVAQPGRGTGKLVFEHGQVAFSREPPLGRGRPSRWVVKTRKSVSAVRPLVVVQEVLGVEHRPQQVFDRLPTPLG